MLDLQNVLLHQLLLHKIGNKAEEEGVQLSKKPVPIEDPSILMMLKHFFLASFKSEFLFHFTHENELVLNEVCHYAKKIFDAPETLHECSIHLANHLYNCSDHPRIKSGEFYVAYFQELKIGNNVTDAIGLFKSENKDTFFKVYEQNDAFALDYEDGININKLDKGCLIFNMDAEEGYKVAIIDNTNAGGQAQYWKDDFLQLKPVENNYYQTQQYLGMCKDFVKEVYNQDREVHRADQADMLNRSIQYFNSKEDFDEKEFMEEVIEEPDVMDAFNSYKNTYQQEKDVHFEEGRFEIHQEAVKSAKRGFRSVIKLDKNFHVYVHGNRDYIHRGYDKESQLHYYQLFFEQEH